MARNIVCTVTNDLNTDQRMHRICRSLAAAGHRVTLVGRVLPHSAPLQEQPFSQVRLRCWRHKGFLFYAEYNLRLFFFLLLRPFDAVNAVDFDTLPAATWASVLRRKPRVFDAHEYFTEVPEVTNRPWVKWIWEQIGRLHLRYYRHAYTVGPALAALFSKQHLIPFEVVRNMPLRRPSLPDKPVRPPYILLYQGALNEGRGIEILLEAMTQLPATVQLWLAGTGDLHAALQVQAQQLQLGDRVQFMGVMHPSRLTRLTDQAWLGLNLLEHRGESYYYSLANKFFDCVQAEVPVLSMQFPEYEALNRDHEVAILLPNLAVATVVETIQQLMTSPERYAKLQSACRMAAAEWCWEREEIKLLRLWNNIFQ
jgi:glycosyltransferase involved in cell wall biosynthesis